MQNQTIINIVDYIIHELSQKGFIIQKYYAYSSNSVYLKLDYGVCNSIRISDHEGKKYLNYRYNVIIDGKTETIMAKYERHYYHQDDINKMIELILSERQLKIDKYGQYRYNGFMNDNKRNHNTDKQGFWKQATTIPAYSK